MVIKISRSILLRQGLKTPQVHEHSHIPIVYSSKAAQRARSSLLVSHYSVHYACRDGLLVRYSIQ